MSVSSWNCATVQMLAAAHTVRCLQHPGLLYLWAVPAICGAESVSDCSLGSICLGFATYFQSRSLAHRCASHWCEIVWVAALCAYARACEQAGQCHLDYNLQEAPRTIGICRALDGEGERGLKIFTCLSECVCENLPNVWVCVCVREGETVRRV